MGPKIESFLLTIITTLKLKRHMRIILHLNRLMGKPTICIGENKGADQLRGYYREADQRLCFRYSDSKISPLLKSEISSFQLFSVLVQLSLCRTCSETTLLVFPRGGSFVKQSSERLLQEIGYRVTMSS